jgi:hypothetical protein
MAFSSRLGHSFTEYTLSHMKVSVDSDSIEPNSINHSTLATMSTGPSELDDVPDNQGNALRDEIYGKRGGYSDVV